MLNDEERVADAVAFMQDRHGTHLFDNADDTATVGLLRQTLIECYGLDRDYVYGSQEEGLPGESDAFFMPWGWDDGQTVRKETASSMLLKGQVDREANPAHSVQWHGRGNGRATSPYRQFPDPRRSPLWTSWRLAQTAPRSRSPRV